MSPQHREIPTYSMDDALQEMAAAEKSATAVVHPPSSLGEAVPMLAVSTRCANTRFLICILGHFDLQEVRSGSPLSSDGNGRACSASASPPASRTSRAWWTDGSLDWFWAACEQEGLPIGLLAGGHMADLGTIAARHPGLKLHIDHCGRGGGGGAGTDDAAFANLGEINA